MMGKDKSPGGYERSGNQSPHSATGSSGGLYKSTKSYFSKKFSLGRGAKANVMDDADGGQESGS